MKSQKLVHRAVGARSSHDPAGDTGLRAAGGDPRKGSGRSDRAVLITGCSSGIGRACAVGLAQRGFTVFASVRSQVHHDELAALGIPHLVPLSPLDLCKPEHIPGITNAVERECTRLGMPGLYALVHNAGAGPVAPLELMDVGKFRAELEARLAGPLALTQALLPSIRRAKGRLAWIQTPGLIPIPYVASIHACDYAANCMARTFGIELAPWNIPSILIRCGGIATAAPSRNSRELAEDMARWPAERRALYGEELAAEERKLAAFDRKRTDPAEVAATLASALTAPRPRRAYRVGHLSRLAGTMEILPQAFADRIMLRRARR